MIFKFCCLFSHIWTAKITKVVKNAKVKTKHTRFWGKCKDLGPRADDPNSTFDAEGEISDV